MFRCIPILLFHDVHHTILPGEEREDEGRNGYPESFLPSHGRSTHESQAWYSVGMTKLLEKAIEQLRELPAEDQNAAAQALFVHMTSGNAEYHLTAEQVREVKRIQRDMRTGKTRLTTKREMAALWKSCGL